MLTKMLKIALSTVAVTAMAALVLLIVGLVEKQIAKRMAADDEEKT